VLTNECLRKRYHPKYQRIATNRKARTESHPIHLQILASAPVQFRINLKMRFLLANYASNTPHRAFPIGHNQLEARQRGHAVPQNQPVITLQQAARQT
jgi:hypothetical protein